MATPIGVCCVAEGNGERKEMGIRKVGSWEYPDYSDLVNKHG